MKHDFHGVITLAYDDINLLSILVNNLTDIINIYSGFEEMLKSAISEL